MKGNKIQRETVKIRSDVVKKVRDFKKKNGIEIGFFFEQAALEKLDRESKK